MNFEIRATTALERDLKRLARKYRRLGTDYAVLLSELRADPRAGEAIPGFADQVFKIRLASSDMKKGKSGGFRVIYYLDEAAHIVWLLTIYAKSEQENPNPVELQDALAELSGLTAQPQDATPDET